MSTVGEKALQRRIVLLERRLAILTLRFEQLNKAAVIMGGVGYTPPATPVRQRHLWVVR